MCIYRYMYYVYIHICINISIVYCLLFIVYCLLHVYNIPSIDNISSKEGIPIPVFLEIMSENVS